MTDEQSIRPKAQRSRACHQCRERRVKCDETPQLCIQCRRLGLKCSGPVQGSVIIDMTHKITKPKTRKKKETNNAGTPTTGAESSPAEERGHNHIVRETTQVSIRPAQPRVAVAASESGQMGHNGMDPLASLQTRYKLQTLYEPSLVDIYDQAFISHFVDLHYRNRVNMQEVLWLSRLHELHSKSPQLALRFSIRAAAMAFYARVHQDPAVLTDSYRWYITSLNRQRVSLSRLDSEKIPGQEHVLVPIILGVYEVYAGTTPMSVFQHLTAASNVLEMIGPRNCASGLAHQLLRALRVSDAHICLIFNQPSVFSSAEWLTLPFTVQTKNVHQQLGDIILSIPPCIALCKVPGPLTEFFSRAIPANTDLRAARARTAQLLEMLQEWATRFPEFCEVDSTEESRRGSTTSSFELVASASPSSSPTSPITPVPLTYTALSASTYHAVYLTLTLLQHKVSCTPTTSGEALPDAVMEEACIHANSVLQISTHLEHQYPLGFDFMRCVFPLVVVLSIAPRDKERRAANEVLARWGAKRGVGGICGPWVMR